VRKDVAQRNKLTGDSLRGPNPACETSAWNDGLGVLGNLDRHLLARTKRKEYRRAVRHVAPGDQGDAAALAETSEIDRHNLRDKSSAQYRFHI